ncbi:MAG TPA: 4Fe-4S binding protein [Desulfatiglandales bacterium]|nr:4Fe-4S binding protein [Desulfatiglandales bacterium]
MAKADRDDEVYLVYVESRRCGSCGECVKMCPVDVFEMPHSAEVYCCLQCAIWKSAWPGICAKPRTCGDN